MKILIATLLVLTSTCAGAGPNDANDRDPELRAALIELRPHLYKIDGVGRLTVVGLGLSLMSFATIGATTTIVRTRALPLDQWNIHPGALMNSTVDKLKYGVFAGAGLALAANIYGGLEFALRHGAPVDVRTADGLNYFFRLSLDEQVARARQDPEFTEYLVSLAQSFARLREGFTPDAARP